MKNCWWNSPHFRCVNPPCPNWLLVNPLVISPLMISYVYYIYYHIVFPLYTVYIHIYIYMYPWLYILYISYIVLFFSCGLWSKHHCEKRPRGWTRPNFRRAHGGWPPMQVDETSYWERITLPIGSMVLPYMVTWIPSIYPLYVSKYTSTMDPMGYPSVWRPWNLDKQHDGVMWNGCFFRFAYVINLGN